jgi:hypothetical protein
MSDVDIVRGFATFVGALRAGGFGSPPEGSWSAEQVAAHVLRNNEHWARTADEVAAGSDAMYDNEVAVDPAELAAFAASVGDLPALADEVERSAAELQAAYDRLSPDQRDVLVHTRIHHEGVTIVDEPRPLGRMLVGNSTFHQQMHDEQLLALRG